MQSPNLVGRCSPRDAPYCYRESWYTFLNLTVVGVRSSPVFLLRDRTLCQFPSLSTLPEIQILPGFSVMPNLSGLASWEASLAGPSDGNRAGEKQQR